MCFPDVDARKVTYVFEMIVTFGPVPEVPAGRRVFTKGEDHKLVVNSLSGNIRNPWSDDEVRASLYRTIHSSDVTTADVVYVLIAEVGEWCTRSDARFLLDWIVARRGTRKGVKMVTNFKELDLENRVQEKSELRGLAVEVVEVGDTTGQKFFRDIVQKYQSAA